MQKRSRPNWIAYRRAADARLTLKRADTLIADMSTLTKALNKRVVIL